MFGAKSRSRFFRPNLVHGTQFGLIPRFTLRKPAEAEVGHRHMRMGCEAMPNAGSAYEREEVYTPMSLRMSDLRLWISKSADYV